MEELRREGETKNREGWRTRVKGGGWEWGGRGQDRKKRIIDNILSIFFLTSSVIVY